MRILLLKTLIEVLHKKYTLKKISNTSTFAGDVSTDTIVYTLKIPDLTDCLMKI